MWSSLIPSRGSLSTRLLRTGLLVGAVLTIGLFWPWGGDARSQPPTETTAGEGADAPATPAEGSRPAPALGSLTRPTPVPDPVDDLESLTPPDGKWLEEDDGREYFVTRLKKVKNTYYKFPGENRILYKRLYRWNYTQEDDEYFYVKVYRADDGVGEPVVDWEKALAERNAKIEESYRYEERTSDRLAFSAFDQGLPREGQWRQGFDVADMNGDGQLDILHGSPRKAIFTPVIFLGDGVGNWTYWEDVTWPQEEFDYGDAAAGDVNGDGLMDIGLGIHLRGVRVLVQESKGRFVVASQGLPYQTPGKGGDASSFASRSVEFADWNGDGRLDLLALGEGARQGSTNRGENEGIPATSAHGLVVFLNEGGGRWRALSSGTYRGVYGDSFAVVDLDGDGNLDVATSSSVMGSRNLLFLGAETEDGWRQADLDSVRDRAFTYAITSGDFDRDGRADLVTSFGTHDGDKPRSGIELQSRDAQGHWQRKVLLVDDAGEAVWALASGDLDGDGSLDVVASTHRGRMHVLLGDGAGGFFLEESPELDSPHACRGYTVRLADLDRDGRDEIVASFAGENTEMERLLGEPECAGQGELRVWHPGPRPGAGSPPA